MKEADSGFLLKGGRPVVLFVDDEEAVLSSLTRALKGEPYNLLTTRRAEEALEWLSHHPVHVLVADQRMPGMTGMELLKSTLAVSPGTRRVMLTGHANTQLEATASSVVRVDQFLKKPWDDARLKETIRSLLPTGRKPEGEGGRVQPTNGLTSVPAKDSDGLTLRLSCTGKTAGEVMNQIETAREGLLRTHDDIHIVLDDLMSLDDSVLALLTQLVRTSFKSGSRVSLSLHLMRNHFGV